ncbi:RDD family protein [Aquicoccus sp. G2-2]|uniref:RDD family protein n=1 Tax=Aquicoccus sp. G2-2 TaxID=3092120 RepID=UPI002AE069EE|nr:RDD family protein [Aquicoccus sp. G2-2]MEA1112790.1 RDD family protein [Aquicoccus sp. G2-2]
MSTTWHLPDPDSQAEFYADVPLKRLLAFVIDSLLLLVATLAIGLLTFGVGLLFAVPLWWFLNLAYRSISLARWSATPAMRLLAIEFRTNRGARLDQVEAFLHSLGFVMSCTFFPLQLLSILLMGLSPRGQGLSDHLMGTFALNRRAVS